MRMRTLFLATSVSAFFIASVALIGGKGVAASQSVSTPTSKITAPNKVSSIHPATLVQLMRGVMFLDSNVIFAAQGKDPAKIPPAKDPSAATNPLEGTYGGWQAVQNASLAIVESASLLTVPGRSCLNGKPVPVDNPDWPKLVQGLRSAGMQSYQAAEAKDRDKILDATDALTTACSNCHTRYRDKVNLADRCIVGGAHQ